MARLLPPGWTGRKKDPVRLLVFPNLTNLEPDVAHHAGLGSGLRERNRDASDVALLTKSPSRPSTAIGGETLAANARGGISGSTGIVNLVDPQWVEVYYEPVSAR